VKWYNNFAYAWEIDQTVTVYWAFFESETNLIYLARAKSMGSIEDANWLSDWDDSTPVHTLEGPLYMHRFAGGWCHEHDYSYKRVTRIYT